MSKKRRKSKQPDLRFGSETGSRSGFTSAGLAGFHNLKPATVVRELLQNSLDAGREAERGLIKIRFEIERHAVDRVPGIASYRSSFKQAVKDQEKASKGKLQDTATGIVEAMRECLESSECETLFVLDNGIGLEKERMKGLLTDGLSVKSDAGTGAVGNGHLTVLPASDLRYVLYGGRTESGEIIGAGHAVLASHQDGGESKSKDGFYVKTIRNDFFEPYVFPENSEVHDYIKSKLEWIARNWEPGSGAVVAVPGFNRFREDGNSLWNMVSKAAACNFFSAFAEGELHVEFVDANDTKILDKTNIASILEQFSEEKRTRSGFLSGSRACHAFRTINEGKDIEVDTGLGRINMRWRSLPQGGLSRVELCRNGMWITDELPKLQRNRFADLKPFHCMILLDASDGEIHRLVRKAEGPLHNHLEAGKWLAKNERAALNKAMEGVFSKLNEVVPTQENQEFEIEDVLAINSNGISSGGRRPGLAGQFQEIRRRPRFAKEADEGEDTEKGPGPDNTTEKKGKGGRINPNRRGRGTFRRSGNAIQFAALPISTGKRSCRVELAPGEKAAGSEVRFAIDESLDESCDAFGIETFARLKNVKVDNRPVQETMLNHDQEDHALGVNLGSLDPAKLLCIEFDYELPTGIVLPDDMPVVLKAQLIRRSPDSKNQEVP
ncbi:MAG: hypothetical protein F4X91_09755 [Nitrospinae bacterium]|nr:hypothetical protein [Nitrospinota bacterium]